MQLFMIMPVPGTVTLAPNALCAVWVAATTVPSSVGEGDLESFGEQVEVPRRAEGEVSSANRKLLQ
jgi:hypothetical protein